MKKLFLAALICGASLIAMQGCSEMHQDLLQDEFGTTEFLDCPLKELALAIEKVSKDEGMGLKKTPGSDYLEGGTFKAPSFEITYKRVTDKTSKVIVRHDAFGNQQEQKTIIRKIKEVIKKWNKEGKKFD